MFLCTTFLTSNITIVNSFDTKQDKYFPVVGTEILVETTGTRYIKYIRNLIKCALLLVILTTSKPINTQRSKGPSHSDKQKRDNTPNELENTVI